MPDCNIRDVLLAHVTLANNDLTTLRDGLAAYFDGAMDRVTGIYKRYLKWISFAVGAVLVVALNADTIAAATALWKDSSLRSQMVENARALVDQKNMPSPDAKQGGAGASDPQRRMPATDLPRSARQKLDGLEQHQAAADWLARPDMKNRLRSAHGCSAAFLYLMKILGFDVGAGRALGALFWFDTLSVHERAVPGQTGSGEKTAGGTSWRGQT